MRCIHPTVGVKLASFGVCEFCLALRQQNLRGRSYLNISNKRFAYLHICFFSACCGLTQVYVIHVADNLLFYKFSKLRNAALSSVDFYHCFLCCCICQHSVTIPAACIMFSCTVLSIWIYELHNLVFLNYFLSPPF